MCSPDKLCYPRNMSQGDNHVVEWAEGKPYTCEHRYLDMLAEIHSLREKISTMGTKL